MSEVEIILTMKMKAPVGDTTAAELEEAVHQEVILAAYKHHLNMQILARKTQHKLAPDVKDAVQFEASVAQLLALHKTWADIVDAAEVDVMLRPLP